MYEVVMTFWAFLQENWVQVVGLLIAVTVISAEMIRSNTVKNSRNSSRKFRDQKQAEAAEVSVSLILECSDQLKRMINSISDTNITKLFIEPVTQAKLREEIKLISKTINDFDKSHININDLFIIQNCVSELDRMVIKLAPRTKDELATTMVKQLENLRQKLIAYSSNLSAGMPQDKPKIENAPLND